MPTIKRFAGAKIQMYFDDHPPPHVHLVEGNLVAKIDIQSGEILIGTARPATYRRARRWIDQNRSFLFSKWDELQT